MVSPDPSAPPLPRPSSAIDFLCLCHLLKTTERTGWVRRGVRKPESVVDHMYGMGITSLVFEGVPGINRDSMKIGGGYLCFPIPMDILVAKEIGELWMEYEENSSPEVKLVEDPDKVEMILQALEYEDGKFQADVGKAWASEVVSRRKRGK